MGYVMTAEEFIEKLKLAASCKTIYIKGCFGAPMNATNKKRYTNNLTYNKNRRDMIYACSDDTFGFDCVCLGKGVLWGWNADKNKIYGGATYKSNGVPDFGADGAIAQCSSSSTDFSNIVPGEVVWIPGHVGYYIGDDKVIECTPAWSNNVQYSNLGNLGYKTGHFRTWKKHGKFKFVDYSNSKPDPAPANPADEHIYYTVVKGDTLSAIGKKYGVPYMEIAKKNNIENPSKIYVGQKLLIK